MINAYKTSVTKQKVSRSAHMMLFSVIKTKLYCLRREYVWVCVYALSNASILIMNINHCMLWNKSNRYLADFHSSFAFSLVFVLFFSFCALFRLQFWATHKKSIKKQIKFNHNRTTETRALYKRNRSRFFRLSFDSFRASSTKNRQTVCEFLRVYSCFTFSGKSKAKRTWTTLNFGNKSICCPKFNSLVFPPSHHKIK